MPQFLFVKRRKDETLVMYMQGLNNKRNKLYKLESPSPNFKAHDLSSQGGERKENV